MTPAEIRKLFEKFGVMLDNDDVWTVQKATVIKHKALERLAAAANVTFDKPQVLRCESDEAVILVHGTMCAADNKNGGSTRHEWSIGEARIVRMVDSGKTNNWGKPVYEPGPDEMGNYQITPKQAAYPFAMAEKRAKDRVILKLAGLHGLYSEDEADEFKESSSAPSGRNAAGAGTPPQPKSAPAAPPSEAYKVALAAMKLSRSKAELTDWWNANKDNIAAAMPDSESLLLVGERNTLGFSLPAVFKEAAE